jgi:hypothetical protein
MRGGGRMRELCEGEKLAWWTSRKMAQMSKCPYVYQTPAFLASERLWANLKELKEKEC